MQQARGKHQPVSPCPLCPVSRHKNASVQGLHRETADQPPHLGEHPGYATWMLGKKEVLAFWKLLVESLGV